MMYVKDVLYKLCGALPITVAVPSKTHWDRGFEPHYTHGCLCAFILFLCCSVRRQRLCDRLIPRTRSPTDCAWIKKLKSSEVHKGCTSIDRHIWSTARMVYGRRKVLQIKPVLVSLQHNPAIN
jgi:hypothetical protein